jgi:hypothetical protein
LQIPLKFALIYLIHPPSTYFTGAVVPGTDSFVTTFTEAKTFIDGRAMENPSFHGGSFISVIVVISSTRHLSSFRFLQLVLQALRCFFSMQGSTSLSLQHC